MNIDGLRIDGMGPETGRQRRPFLPGTRVKLTRLPSERQITPHRSVTIAVLAFSDVKIDASG
jgi:hypothetical protein